MVTVTLDFHTCTAQLQIEPKKSAKTSATGRVALVSPILPHNSRHNQRNKAQIQAQQHPTQHKRQLPRLRKHTCSFLYVPRVLRYSQRNKTPTMCNSTSTQHSRGASSLCHYECGKIYKPRNKAQRMCKSTESTSTVPPKSLASVCTHYECRTQRGQSAQVVRVGCVRHFALCGYTLAR